MAQPLGPGTIDVRGGGHVEESLLEEKHVLIIEWVWPCTWMYAWYVPTLTFDLMKLVLLTVLSITSYTSLRTRRMCMCALGCSIMPRKFCHLKHVKSVCSEHTLTYCVTYYTWIASIYKYATSTHTSHQTINCLVYYTATPFDSWTLSMKWRWNEQTCPILFFDKSIGCNLKPSHHTVDCV